MRKTANAILFLIIQLITINCYSQIITTFVGNGMTDYSGGGHGTAAGIGNSGDIIYDNNGNFFVGVNPSWIVEISPSGNLITVAGNGSTGFSGDNGPATNAAMNGPSGLAVDRNGNIYFDDYYNWRIRRVDKLTGIITTIAGTGTCGFSGDNGPATSAMICANGLAIDKYGNLFVADVNNYRIRKIDTFGIISTFAGIGVMIYSGDGGFATSAGLYYPIALAFDTGERNLLVVDGNEIRSIDMNSNIISYVSGLPTQGFAGDGGPASLAAFSAPISVACDKLNNIYVSDLDNDRIRLINAISDTIITYVGNGNWGYNGDGGLADTSELNSPRGIITDSCGNLFICDNGNLRIREVIIPYCQSLSANDIFASTNSQLVIYPNPATEELHIEGIKYMEKYRLLNIKNNIAQTGNLQMGNNTIHIQHLPPGMYFLEMIDEKGYKVVRKVVKVE